MIRFECDCSACFGVCPTINCTRRRRETTQRKLRYARHNSFKDEFLNKNLNMENENDPLVLRILRNLSITSSKMSFSAVITIEEDDNKWREMNVLNQLKKWNFSGILFLI